VVLFIPFYRSVGQHLGRLPLVTLVWRPAVATLLLGGTLWGLRGIPSLVALVGAGVVYLVALIGMRAFTEEDKALARALLPRRLRTWRPMPSLTSRFS
jgi:hypothetical protein